MKIRICLCLTTLLAACSTPLQSPEVTVADITDTPGIEEISDVILSPDVTPDPDQETTFPDLVPDELQPDTAVPGCEPGMGCFLDGCDDNSNCQSGWCVQHLGEGVCSQICQEDCPPGWSCQQVAGTDPDVIYICVSDFANLCRPCAGGDDCTSTGGAEDACLDYGLEGSFCGGPCDTDKDCPWGFSCAETVTVDGADIQQCMAEIGRASCRERV